MITMRRLLVPTVAALLLAGPIAAPADAAGHPAISSITAPHRTFSQSPAAGNVADPDVTVINVTSGQQVTLTITPAGGSSSTAVCTPVGSSVTFNGAVTGCSSGGTFSLPTANMTYTITATDADGSSAAWQYHHDTTAPFPVSSITGAPTAGAGIALTWGQVVDAITTGQSGVAHYELEREKNDSSTFSPVTSLDTPDSSCTTGTCSTEDRSDGSLLGEPVDGQKYRYKVAAVDLAGNRSSTSPASNQVTADGTAPAAPTVDVTPAQRGDSTPVIAATRADAMEGGTLTVLANGNPVGQTIYAAGSGTYTWNSSSTDPVADLGADGTYSLKVRIEDAVGNTADSGSISYTVDSGAAPTIASLAGTTTSPAAGQGTTPAVVVSGALAGDTIILSADTDGSGTVEPDESYGINTADGGDVAYNSSQSAADFTITGTNRAVTFTATRTFGDTVSDASAPFVYEWDTTAPATPAAPSVAQSGTGGLELSWAAVADAAPYADRPVVYQIRRASAAPTDPTTCPAPSTVSPTHLDQSATTSYTDESAADGTCAYYAIVAVDRVGNASFGPTSAGVLVDTAAPPVPSTPTVESGQTSSHDPGHGNDPTPVISTTTGAEGGTLQLLVDDVAVGDPIAASPATAYTWNGATGPVVDLGALGGDGTYAVKVSITDGLGNRATTPATGYSLDRVAPADAAISQIDGRAPPTATSDTTPAVVVTGGLTDEYAILALDHDGDGTTADVSVERPAPTAVTFNDTDSDFTLSGADRSVELTATLRDQAGNLSAAPSTASLDLDTTPPPAPSIDSVRQLSGSRVEIDWTDVADAAPYADRPVTYDLWRDVEAPVSSVCPDAALASPAPHASAIDLSLYVDADSATIEGQCVYYQAVAVDQTGAPSSASAKSAGLLVVAGTLPGAPVITSVEGDGTSPAAGDSTTPTVVVTPDEPGGTVHLLAGATVVASQAVGDAPGVTVTIDASDYTGATPPGVSTLTATHENNGQTSAASTGFDYRAPPAPPTIQRVEGDASSPASGTDPTPDVTVAGVVAGHTVTLFATPSGSSTPTQVAEKVATTDTVSFATSDYPGSLTSGTYTLTATAIDPEIVAAGGTGRSASSSGFSYERIAVVGGYLLDGWGGIHSIGSTVRASGQPYFPGHDVARDIALVDPSDPSKGGYVLDAWGGIHAFNGAVKAKGGPYWRGQDIARDLVVTGPGKGYVLDLHGGIHPFGGAPRLTGGAYWPGQDIARRLVLISGGGGYVLDGFGAPHRFGGAPRLSGGPYWLGWDIANDMALIDPADPSKGGYILDGWGGVHAVGAAPKVSVSAYQAGQDHRFHSLAVIGSGAGYTADTRGQVARFGSAPAVIRPATFSFDIGRGLVIATL